MCPTSTLQPGKIDNSNMSIQNSISTLTEETHPAAPEQSPGLVPPFNLSELVTPVISRIPKSAAGVELQRLIAQIVELESDEFHRKMQAILDFFLRLMEIKDASDIDLGANGCGGQVWYRIHGSKAPLDDIQYSKLATDILCQSVLNVKQREYMLQHRNLDFSYAIETADEESQRFRADMYFDMDHLALNMRRIQNEIRPFKNLHLHPRVAKTLSLNYFKSGLTLVTGITGSGKSATLDTIIDANNRTVHAHIVIIASPVELEHSPRKSIVRHREVGRDVSSFKNGAVEALRQDPDIIVISELRDPETIMTALEITDSGHKTFGTLHTASAVESIDRIIGETPPSQQRRVQNRLADVLTCVISQKLIPSLDGKRVLAKEILLVNPSVQAAIRNNNTGEIYQMMQEGHSSGMQTMEQDLKRLYDEGLISRTEAMNNANNKKRIEQLFEYS